MSSGRSVTVLAATGKQGSSVVKNLLEDGFKVRATTRDVSSEKANKLKAQGAEVVKADMDDKESLKSAFKGNWAAYTVTDFYQEKVKKNPELEFEQGKNAIDAAIAAKVDYCIYSSLDNVSKISGNTLNVPHFTNKNRVGEYLLGKSSEVKGILIMPAFYMQNFTDLMPAQRSLNGEVVFSFPFPGTVRLPIIDINDTGKVITGILKNPDQYVGKETLVCGDYPSLNEIVEKFTQVTGVKAVYHQATDEEMRKNLPDDLREEFMDMFKWFEKYGYYGPRDVKAGIQEARKIVGDQGWGLNTWSQWLAISEWKGPGPNFVQKAASMAHAAADGAKNAAQSAADSARQAAQAAADGAKNAVHSIQEKISGK